MDAKKKIKKETREGEGGREGERKEEECKARKKQGQTYR
jgi:hypothetical protein